MILSFGIRNRFFSSDTNCTLISEDLQHHSNSVCKEKLSDECRKLLWVRAERPGDIQTAAGLACSGAARCFHKGQSSKGPLTDTHM